MREKREKSDEIKLVESNGMRKREMEEGWSESEQRKEEKE